MVKPGENQPEKQEQKNDVQKELEGYYSHLIDNWKQPILLSSSESEASQKGELTPDQLKQIERFEKSLENTKEHKFFDEIEVSNNVKRSLYEDAKYWMDIRKADIERGKLRKENTRWLEQDYQQYERFLNYMEQFKSKEGEEKQSPVTSVEPLPKPTEDEHTSQDHQDLADAKRKLDEIYGQPEKQPEPQISQGVEEIDESSVGKEFNLASNIEEVEQQHLEDLKEIEKEKKAFRSKKSDESEIPEKLEKYIEKKIEQKSPWENMSDEELIKVGWMKQEDDMYLLDDDEEDIFIRGNWWIRKKESQKFEVEKVKETEKSEIQAPMPAAETNIGKNEDTFISRKVTIKKKEQESSPIREKIPEPIVEHEKEKLPEAHFLEKQRIEIPVTKEEAIEDLQELREQLITEKNNEARKVLLQKAEKIFEVATEKSFTEEVKKLAKENAEKKGYTVVKVEDFKHSTEYHQRLEKYEKQIAKNQRDKALNILWKNMSEKEKKPEYVEGGGKEGRATKEFFDMVNKKIKNSGLSPEVFYDFLNKGYRPDQIEKTGFIGRLFGEPEFKIWSLRGDAYVAFKDERHLEQYNNASKNNLVELRKKGAENTMNTKIKEGRTRMKREKNASIVDLLKETVANYRMNKKVDAVQEALNKLQNQMAQERLEEQRNVEQKKKKERKKPHGLRLQARQNKKKGLQTIRRIQKVGKK